MQFWGLFGDIDKEQLEEGVATMLKVTKELLAVQQGSSEERRMLDDGDQQEDNGDPSWAPEVLTVLWNCLKLVVTIWTLLIYLCYR